MTALNITAIVWTLLALALVPMQLRVTAPYGRHARTDWGPSIPNRLGWCLMELVSLVVFAGLFLAGTNEKTAPMWVFFALWTAHYVNRSLIFPWRTHTEGKTIPVAIVGSAAAFNIVNAGLNGLYLGWFGAVYPVGWLTDPRFTSGLVVFLVGAAINQWSDNRLIGLRAGGGPGEGGRRRYGSAGWGLREGGGPGEGARCGYGSAGWTAGRRLVADRPLR